MASATAFPLYSKEKQCRIGRKIQYRLNGLNVHSERSKYLWMFLMRLFAVLTICMVITGCGTFRNIGKSPSTVPESATPSQLVYGGVKSDLQEIRQAVDSLKQVPDSAQNFASILGTAIFYSIDLPVSTFGDTVTLPLTVPAAIDRAVVRHYFPQDKGHSDRPVSDHPID